ncbi:MAG TPA: hypothetical protein VMG12_11525 [Polyangiaceae bacterium]|nr:hypothetical protein [Polyangiaceae bacterium]
MKQNEKRTNVGRVVLAFGVGMALSLTTLVASAQTQESKTDDGYGYSFDDDPLNAGGFGPNDATIRVRARAARTTLIRPRTSFVPEMLKSVENL